MKGFAVYYVFHNLSDNIQESAYGNETIWFILYISFIIATTILCTLLIIFRIITVSNRGMGIQTFRGIIEIIVESALIYSITLLVYVIVIACDGIGVEFIEILAISARVCFIHLLFYTQS